MKHLLCSFAALGLVLAAGTQAHGPAVSRYRVSELPVPNSLRAGCLEGYVASGGIQRINDFGVANANFRCYTQADPSTGTFQARDAAFVAAPWFGALELSPPAVPGFSFGSTINNRGEIFGFETVEGGFPACDGRLAAVMNACFSIRRAAPSRSGEPPTATAVTSWDGDGVAIPGCRLRWTRSVCGPPG